MGLIRRGKIFQRGIQGGEAKDKKVDNGKSASRIITLAGLIFNKNLE